MSSSQTESHTIARRIIARIHPSRFVDDPEYRQQQIQLVRRSIGGFCIMDGTIDSVEETISTLTAGSEHPLLFAIDAETGPAMRIAGLVEFPHAFALGRTTRELTRHISEAAAQQLRSLGIVWNFAPVCDVHTNTSNPIVGIRAFATDAPTVTEHVIAWIDGHRRYGVACCAKHFPGHGDVTVDSHCDLPVVEHTVERLVNLELVPFYAAIKQQVESIMVGHLSIPSLDASGTPASLSSEIIRNFLRERLGYEGIIITDALDMKAITSRLPCEKAVIDAFVAGADVALMPEDASVALDTAQYAYEQGLIPQAEHHAALMRIEQQLASTRHADASGYYQADHANLALHAALQAMSIRGDGDILPLHRYRHIAAFAVVGYDDALDAPTTFFHYLGQLYKGNMDVAYISDTITSSDIQSYAEAIDQAECLIVAIFERPRAGRPLMHVSENIKQALQLLSSAKRRIAIVAGNPDIPIPFEAELTLWTFSDSDPSCAAVAIALTQDSNSEIYKL